MNNQLQSVLDRLYDILAGVCARLGINALSSGDSEQVYALPSPRYEAHLTIPTCDKTPDQTMAEETQERGQFLARQDRWADLIAEIREADQARTTTAGGQPICDLLAYGARADVIQAVEHALQDRRPEEDFPLIEGIRSLESLRSEFKGEPYVDLIVALAHLDIGWAWRGAGGTGQLPLLNRSKCIAHFDRASEILSPHNGLELDSPAIAAAHCALLVGHRDPKARVADDYEDLIDLDPRNPRHMRALGYHLLPGWFGSYGQLDLEARRTAGRTEDIWGTGGYTWVCFDAILIDEEACGHIDVGFFIDGLTDIIDARPEQEMANLLAAYCAVAIRQSEGSSTEGDLNRSQIAECANWLIRDHLREIHPLVWAHAVDGFDNNLRVNSLNRFATRGRRYALQAIGDLFRDEIGMGHHITFTESGPRLQTA